METKALEVVENVKLALRSVYRFLALGTMKLKGIMGGKEVIVLIDGGQPITSHIRDL